MSVLGTFTKLQVAANNPNLPRLNEMRFPYITATPGISTVKLSIRTDAELPVTIGVTNISQGEFFSDAAGTVSLGITVNIGTVAGAKTYYFKAYTNGTIYTLNSQEINRFGVANADWSETNYFISNANNCRVAGFNLSQLATCPHLEAFVITTGYAYGDISVLSQTPSLTTIAFNQNDTYGQVTGSTSVLSALPLFTLNISGLSAPDVSHLPTTIANLQFAGKGQGRYSGDGTVSVSTTYFRFFGATPSTTAMPTAEVDNLLKALALGITAPSLRNLTIRGARTSASDAAVATLTSKNYTVVLV